MRVAEALSDLTTLRMSEHETALALVSTRIQADGQQGSVTAPSKTTQSQNPDLRRAYELLKLHKDFRTGPASRPAFGQAPKLSGLDLERARSSVDNAMQRLGLSITKASAQEGAFLQAGAETEEEHDDELAAWS